MKIEVKTIEDCKNILNVLDYLKTKPYADKGVIEFLKESIHFFIHKAYVLKEPVENDMREHDTFSYMTQHYKESYNSKEILRITNLEPTLANGQGFYSELNNKIQHLKESIKNNLNYEEEAKYIQNYIDDAIYCTFDWIEDTYNRLDKYCESMMSNIDSSFFMVYKELEDKINAINTYREEIESGKLLLKNLKRIKDKLEL